MLKIAYTDLNLLIETYGATPPKIPPGFEHPAEFRPPLYGECYIDTNHKVVKHNFKVNIQRKLLIVKPKPTRYKFVCDDPTPRHATFGEWVINSFSGKFMQITQLKSYDDQEDVLVFRREEVPYEDASNA